MTVWVDGKFLEDGEAPQPGVSLAPFETMGAHAGMLPMWSEHERRLLRAAARCGIAFAASPALRRTAAELLAKNGHADGVLRLLLVPDGGAVRTVLTTRARSATPVVRLLPTVVQRAPTSPPADMKAFPRSYHDAVLAQARAGGADDGIAIAPDGAVLETALGNLWLRIDGTWVTPALDGRVLPGIARARLLSSASASGLRLVERACDLGDLHRASALAHSNAVYGPRTAYVLGARPAVEIVDTELGSLWRATANG